MQLGLRNGNSRTVVAKSSAANKTPKGHGMLLINRKRKGGRRREAAGLKDAARCSGAALGAVPAWPDSRSTSLLGVLQPRWESKIYRGTYRKILNARSAFDD